MDTDPIGRHETRQPPIDLFDDYRGRHRGGKHRAPGVAPERHGRLSTGVVALVAAYATLTVIDGALLTDPPHDRPAGAAPLMWPGDAHLFDDTSEVPARPMVPAPLGIAVPVALTVPMPTVKAVTPPAMAPVRVVKPPARQRQASPEPTPAQTEPATTLVAPADKPVCAPEPVTEPTEPAPEATPEPEPSSTPKAEPLADPSRNPRADEVANGPKPEEARLPLDGTSSDKALPTQAHQGAEPGVGQLRR